MESGQVDQQVQTSGSSYRGRGRGRGRGYYRGNSRGSWTPRPNIQNVNEERSETSNNGTTTTSQESTTPSSVQNSANETTQTNDKIATSQQQNMFTRIQIENLHPFVTDEELFETFCEMLAPTIKVHKAHVILYGPKSTTKGWVELYSPQDALTALFKLQGFLLREQPLQLTLERKNRIERTIKRDKYKKKPSKELPYKEELDQVKSKFGETFQFITEEPPVSFRFYFLCDIG